MLQDILVQVIALRDFYHTSHVMCKNVAFYGDHLLLQRLYEGCDGFVDGLMEKIVGTNSGDINLPTIYKKVFEKIKSLPYAAKDNVEYFKAAAALEDTLRSMIETLDKTEGTSAGICNMIGGIADASEERCYLIKQRIGSVAVAPVAVKL